MARLTSRIIGLLLLAAAVSAPPAQGELALPGTTGGVHLHSHVHLYRLLPVPSTRMLPDEAAAGEFARTHDQISGEWASGSASVSAGGLLGYPTGGRAEPDMLVANPDLSLILYLNGTGIEQAFFPPFFPAAWYASSGPNEFDTYDADTADHGAVHQRGIWNHRQRLAGLGRQVQRAGCWRMPLPAPTTGSTWTACTCRRTACGDRTASPTCGRTPTRARWWSPTACWTARRTTAARGATLGHGDVANIEFWLSQPAPSGAQFPSVARWEADVSAAIDAQARGSAVQTMTKLFDNRLSQEAVRQWRELTVASYLIANRGHLLMELSAFGGINDWGWPRQSVPWQAAWRFWQEGAEHFRIYGAHVGASTDPADAAAGADRTKAAVRAYLRGGVYQRRFASGLAAVNPKATAVKLQLDARTYFYARNGQRVTSRTVTLPAHSGLVLTLVPTPPPTELTGCARGSGSVAHVPRILTPWHMPTRVGCSG